MAGLHLTDEGKQMLAGHWHKWIATRLRQHEAGMHRDEPSKLCPTCQAEGRVETPTESRK